MNKKLKKRDRGGVDDYPDAPANMTAKKYNKKHRVLDLDARDARRREESVARSAKNLPSRRKKRSKNIGICWLLRVLEQCIVAV